MPLTVHTAQGVTADTTHAVLSETATRALLYVAMTRGREANTAYLYQRITEHEYPAQSENAAHISQRGTGRYAADLLRGVVANSDQPVTAHEVAVATPDDGLAERVRDAKYRRAASIRSRCTDYERWFAAADTAAAAMRQARWRHAELSLTSEHGIEL